VPLPVHSIAETLLSLSDIQAHLMYLGENMKAQKTEENIYQKKT
jgi:hypothetical protein